MLKNERQEHKKRCKSRISVKKHKYAYILGEDKRETKKLNRIFFKNNSKLNVFNYPKERGKA